ncbi:hypothetical protein LOTGIDRAFT_232648 [Lottia gigantea]|uniref:Uncharacterized protein n=1 Tax=Lottia gigantea TaxID=225164 RepID=V4BX26_LOTGI|nr:hypothetical protein LOTGIDRAFT_232648 [Lottia gigantea]ESO93609.1 hypothetical protein LOTGIDRAFT_232648 [Lottia gigantea]
MNLFYVLFLIPLVASQSSGLPGNQCGGVICLDSNDVTCNAESNECKCNAGKTGNGRFVCVDATESCVCYLYGDPYVTGFSTSEMSINLPCQHILAEFTTPNGIKVKVTAIASQRNERNYPGYVFEDGLLFEASKGNTLATAMYKRDGFWNKGLKVKLPFSGNFPDFGVYCSVDEHQYWTLELPRQGIVVRFRSADSSVTIQAPKQSQFVSGRPCGQCEGDSNSYKLAAQQSGLNIKQWSLVNAFNNLDTQRETDPVCKSLGTAYNSCSENQRSKAVQFCGAPFSNHQIGECFSQKFGKRTLLSMVQACINAYCQGSVAGWCQATLGAKTSCSNSQVDFEEITKYCGI